MDATNATKSSQGLSSVENPSQLLPARGEAPAAEERRGGRMQHYNKYVVACTLLASLNSILLGYDIGVMSGAALFINDQFRLSTLELQLLVGSLNLVSLVGALMAGKVADVLGRKKTMATAAAIFFIGALLMALAPSFGLLMGGRVLSGIGVGFAMIIAPVYTAELAPPGSRGSLVSFGEVFINTGILIGYVANFALSPLPHSLGWRFMLGLGALPSIFLACAVLIMPESPRWLVVQGRITEAKEVLLRTCAGNKEEAESRLAAIVESLGDEYVEDEDNNNMENEDKKHGEAPVSKTDAEAGTVPELNRRFPSVSSEKPFLGTKKLKKRGGGGKVWKQLLWPSAPVRRMLIVSLGIHFFQQASGVDALVYYSPTVFRAAGMRSRTSILGMTTAVGLTKTLFILVATFYLDTRGRRPLLLASATGMTLSLAMVATTFRFLGGSAGEKTSVSVVVVAMLGICAFMASFSIGFGPTVYVLTSEIFPLTLRARAMSMSIAMNRGISGVISLTYLSLEKAVTTSGAFSVYTGIAAASVVFIFFVVPETKGKSLEEVCKYFGWEPEQDSNREKEMKQTQV